MPWRLSLQLHVISLLLVTLVIDYQACSNQAPPGDDGSNQAPRNCAMVLSVAEGTAVATSSEGCEREPSATDLPLTWTCDDLQSALDALPGLVGVAPMPSQEGSNFSDCVSVIVPTGRHIVTNPVFVGNLSVQIIGNNDTNNRPIVACNYHVPVDLDRLFDFTYTYVNSTLYFQYSDYFLMDGLEVMGCQFPLRLDTVGRVVIQHCIFHNFSEAVFDIFNSPEIFITDSSFHDNEGTGISRIPLRANTGAVAISLNTFQQDISSPPTVTVSRCDFTNNSATAGNAFRTTSNAFFNRIFTGRGGGLGIFINESYHNITGRIYDNHFEGNFARSFGGGLFMVIFGDNTQNILYVTRNTFVNNVALLGAGGLLMTFFSTGLLDAPHSMVASDCDFRGNAGESGGAILVYLAYEVDGFSFFKLERCNFSRNTGVGSVDDYGSALATWLVNNLRDKQTIPQNEVVDCIFEENDGTNGIVSIGYVPVRFNGSNFFIRNRGTSSLRIIGVLVDLFGYLEFTENSVSSAAALELLSFGQIRLHYNLQMNLTGNLGRFGAGIISSNVISTSEPLQRLAFNPQCFILYENSAAAPSEWRNVSVLFRRNEAVLASSLYVTTLDSCTWFSQNFPFFDQAYILRWPLWDFGNDSINSGYADPYALEHHVQTAPQILETATKTVKAWPGQKFNVTLTGWDELSNPTSASARFLFTQHGGTEEANVLVTLQPEIVIIDSGDEDPILVTQFQVEYAASSREVITTGTLLGTVDINVLFESNRVTGDSFYLIADLCPGGYELLDGGSEVRCHCKDQVQEVLNCEGDQDSVIIQNGFWVSTVASNSSFRHVMSFYTCPAGYCRCAQNSSLGQSSCVFMYVNSNPDAQCHCNRHGVLCGECKDGQGVTVLFDRCDSCDNLHAFLILLLIVVDVVVIVLLVLADRKWPTQFFTFTFYIQIVPLTALYFPETFDVAGQYLYYVSSFLSLYFPYDFCLYDKMSPLVSYFLRLVPFLLVLKVAVPLSIIVSHTKWRGKHQGVWILLLLIYTHTVHSAMSILNCSYITVGQGLISLRWYVDGSVQCFTGGHVPLALLAILILLVCVAAIPVTAVIALKRIPRRLYWLYQLEPVLVRGFREGYGWWVSVELGRRFLAVLLIVLVPRHQVYLLLFLSIILLAYGFTQPYHSTLNNILEIIVEINFSLLLLLVSSAILEPFYALPPVHFDNSVPEGNSSCGGHKEGVAAVVWFLAPLYYFPFLLMVGVVIRFLVLFLNRKKHSKMRSTSPLTDDSFLAGTPQFVSPFLTTQVVGIWSPVEEDRSLGSSDSQVMTDSSQSTKDIHRGNSLWKLFSVSVSQNLKAGKRPTKKFNLRSPDRPQVSAQSIELLPHDQ